MGMSTHTRDGKNVFCAPSASAPIGGIRRQWFGVCGRYGGGVSGTSATTGAPCRITVNFTSGMTTVGRLLSKTTVTFVQAPTLNSSNSYLDRRGTLPRQTDERQHGGDDPEHEHVLSSHGGEGGQTRRTTNKTDRIHQTDIQYSSIHR